MVSPLSLVQESWSAAGHAATPAWLVWLPRVAAAVIVLLYLALLARAALRRRWYRAEGVLGEEDLRALRAELAAVEKKTVGEIVPVILERSDRHDGATWLAALTFVLLGSALFALWRPVEDPALRFLLELALGALGYLTTRMLPDFQRFFLGEGRATEMAEEQALQEFHRHGLHRTEGRTGVLLFVSLLERRVIVLADEGIHGLAGEDPWRDTDEAILGGIRAGSLRDGMLAGIRGAGAVLAQHFPAREGDRNEVPDRVIVRRE